VAPSGSPPLDAASVWSFLRSAPDGVLVTAASGVIELASDAAKRLTGQQQLEGRSLLDLVCPEDRTEAEAFVRAVLVGSRPAPRDIRLSSVEGPPRWAEWKAELVSDASGAATHVVLIVREIEHRREAESQTVKAMERAEQTVRELGDTLRALEDAAMTDTLTGVYNRRQFEIQAQAEIARSHRYGQPVSLALVDLDEFKPINDTFGHAVGDQILVVATAAIQRTLRACDSLFRWGGDEFVVLTPGVSGVGALRVAERMRTAVAELEAPGPGRITVSVGVAALVPWEKVEQWMKRADDALYRAKHAGRNRSEVAARPSEAPPERILQLVWDGSYECGDPLIDAQHRELFVLGNAVIDEALSGTHPERLGERMAALVTSLAQHFADEDAMLTRIAFPQAAAHADLHRRLAAEACGVQEAVRLGAGTVLSLVDFIVRRVVTEHLFAADRSFFPYVKQDLGWT
jgi:diguanylate cyclase (GGDEF)-like protein/hemerythrin-like metal-binding protein/PAS domain S-box-containing protein